MQMGLSRKIRNGNNLMPPTNEPAYDKTNKVACAHSVDQPGHSPSLIRVFAVLMKNAWVLSDPLSAHIILLFLTCAGSNPRSA